MYPAAVPFSPSAVGSRLAIWPHHRSNGQAKVTFLAGHSFAPVLQVQVCLHCQLLVGVPHRRVDVWVCVRTDGRVGGRLCRVIAAAASPSHVVAVAAAAAVSGCAQTGWPEGHVGVWGVGRRVRRVG
jgi:hypothetical protein